MIDLNYSRTLTAQLFAAGLLVVTATSMLAGTRYVDVNNLNSTPPYTNWATAATNIQDAVDAAVAGDEIMVTNGTYRTGVTVDKPLSVRSVNGPQFTIIDGGHSNRCVYLTSRASLSGLTLTNGFASSYGGGVFCESPDAVVSNCVVSGNAAISYSGSFTVLPRSTTYGGGAYGGTLNSCFLSNNTASGYFFYRHDLYFSGVGGGASSCNLNNCTLIGNYGSVSGGGAEGCTLNNCTLTGNSAWGGGGGAVGCWLNNCTLTGNSAHYGGGASAGYGGGVSDCTLNNCRLIGNSSVYDGGGTYNCTLNNCTLSGNSADGGGGGASGGALNNCIVYFNTAGVGANYDSSSTLSYCCTTPQPTNGLGNITNEPAFVNLAAGNYRLRSDSPCIDVGTNLSASITNDLDGRARPLDGNGDGLAAFDMGAYEYRMPLLVWQGSPNPSPPHTDWATAAHTIQDAVDAATAGDEIVVTNGVYATGGRAVDGTMTNRVAVDKPLTLWSVNGPQFTIIQGSASANGDGAIRCAYLTNGASLSGFTLTNGATRIVYDYPTHRESSGGGLWCESTKAVTVSNCVVAGNWAYASGGGAYGGTLNNCMLSGNLASGFDGDTTTAASGGGAANATLNNCTVTGNRANNGGGAYGSTLSNCTLNGNGAGFGGGAYSSTLNNCTLTTNSAVSYIQNNLDPPGGAGGGAYACTLNNCTLSGNSALRHLFFDDYGRYGSGGGTFSSTLKNCIVYFNYAGSGADYDPSSTLNYSCTTLQPTNGIGNITNAPLFVDQLSGNLRLQSNSPCINAGLNALVPAGPDLDGNLRIAGGTVDIGAYEFQAPPSILPYAWLQQYGLPTNGSADYADPDGDGLNNWQEWRCGTDPNNALSALRLLAPVTAGTNVIVTWQSVAGVSYFLERATTLSAAPTFTSLVTNISGQPGTTTYTDTNAIGAGPWFYRVGVSTP